MRKELQDVTSDRGTFRVFIAGYLAKIHNALKAFLEVGLIRQNRALLCLFRHAAHAAVLAQRIGKAIMRFTSQGFSNTACT